MFQSGPMNCHTLGSEAKKKKKEKATKATWWQWGGRAEKNLR